MFRASKAWSVAHLCAGGICILLGADAAAAERFFAVSISVPTKGVNLRDPGEARKFYRKLEFAAYVVCTRGNRAGLEPLADPKDCEDRSLANAIQSAGARLLARIFLETHTLQLATALGVDIVPRVAAK